LIQYMAIYHQEWVAVPSVNTAPLPAINPSERYATTNFLEADFGGSGGWTFSTSELSGPVALRSAEGGRVSSE
jgi:hypothetical protein